MPQVHIIGQVLGATGFAQDKLFCKYKINYDHRSMRLVDGEPEDQTQLSATSVSAAGGGERATPPSYDTR